MNPHRTELIEQNVKERQLQIALLRDKTAKSLYLFNKYILKVEEGQDKVKLAPFHKELCDFVQDNQKRKKLILIPRGHLKSTLITVGYPLWRIVNNPSIRILIQNATYQTAADFVRAIKRQLEGNQELIEVYGDLAAGAEEWAESRFTLKGARVGQNGKESTVTGWGVETSKTGQHYDLIIHDDLVERENMGTRDQLEKVILRYRDSLDLLDPGGQMIVIGTRWTDGDLYDWIMDKQNDIISSYDTMIKPALLWDGQLSQALESGVGIKSILWPDKFTQPELYTRYREKGPYEFSCQYLNDPVPDESATFKREWFRYYEDDDLRGLYLNTYITCDPAISLEKEADFSAIPAVSIDQYGNVFVRDLDRGKYTPSQLIQRLFNEQETFHALKMGIEDVAYQKALSYNLKEEALRRGRHLPVEEINPGSRSKDQRIMALQPLYAAGKVFHRKGMRNLEFLEDELLRFPRGKHDDTIDALSMVLPLMHRPRIKSEERTHRYLY